MATNETRICNVCLIEYPITEFAKNGKDSEGNVRRRPDCRTCYNINRGLKPSAVGKFNSSMKQRLNEESTYSLEDWRDALIHWRGRCAYCGCKPAKRGETLTKDHVEPIVSGGKTTKNNIVPACRRCNNSKGSSNVVYWYRRQKFFNQEMLQKVIRWHRGETSGGR